MTVSITGYDYSFAVPQTAALIEARAGFVVRYLSQDPSKNITAGELAQLQAAHIPLVLVYEDAADWMLGGAAAGRAAAILGRGQADAAGVPPTVPVYLAADFSPTESQLDAVIECAAAWADADGIRPGLYGPYDVAAAAVAAGYAAWQTSGESYGQVEAAAVLYQDGQQVEIGGVTVDVDQAHAFNFGQYTPPAPPWPGFVFTYAPAGPQLHSPAVIQWQQRMADRGWTIDVDGWYGPESEQVCRDFQAEFATLPPPGLTEDGQVGPYTWAAAFTIPITNQ